MNPEQAVQYAHTRVDEFLAQSRTLPARLSDRRTAQPLLALLPALLDAACTPHSPEVPEAARAAAQALTREDLAEFGNTLSAAAVARLWRRSRVVYTLDADAWQALRTFDADDVIPSSVFARLPHPDPYIAFPEPVELTYASGVVESYRGFFVAGERAGALDALNLPDVCSALSGDRTKLRLTFVGDVTGHPTADQVTHQVNVDPAAGTLAQIAQQVADGYTIHDPSAIAGTPSQEVLHLLRPALTTLVFVCARNADLRSIPAAAGRKVTAPGGQVRKPAKVVGVGWRLGAALRASRSYPQQRERVGGGRSLAAHIRRAHLHLYWVGPGRAEPEFRWIDPVLVGAGEHRTTVVRVPGPA